MLFRRPGTPFNLLHIEQNKYMRIAELNSVMKMQHIYKNDTK